MSRFYFFCLLFTPFLLNGQITYYVSQQSGSDLNNGTSANTPFKTVDYATDNLEKGDTLYFMGTFTNDSFDEDYKYANNINDPHIWTQENTMRISGLDGTASQYITLKAYDGNTVLKGDGANIFRMQHCSYIRIEGFEIYGQVDSIPLSTALALQFLYREENSTNSLYRVAPGTSEEDIEHMTFVKLKNVSRPSYTSTRGMYLSDVHHIDILNNTIHHMTGGGLRVSDCEYINIINNEVHNCARKSYAGTHALVVTKASSSDTNNGYKINILNNKVHHNYNEIFSWAPSKTNIEPTIDEGKGISLQRNDNLEDRTWTHGRFLVANNITYWNGYSGLHSNDGDRIDFINNISYLNSYTKTVTYNGTRGGGNIGISASGGKDIKMYNNISVIDGNLEKSAIAAANITDLVVQNNLIHGTVGTIKEDPEVVAVQRDSFIEDPKFVNPPTTPTSTNNDFRLKSDSPIINEGNISNATADDHLGQARDASPDIGAIEYSACNALPNWTFNNKSIQSNSYIAPQTIITGANVFIQPHAAVNFQAGTSITLKPGFFAKASSNFHAHIVTDCGNTILAERPVVSRSILNTAPPSALDLIVYPNPSRGNFSVDYYLDQPQKVSIQLFKSVGTLVATLANNQEQNTGQHQISSQPANLLAGSYFLVVQLDKVVFHKQLVIVD